MPRRKDRHAANLFKNLGLERDLYSLADGQHSFHGIQKQVLPTDSQSEARQKLTDSAYAIISKHKPLLSRKERRAEARALADRTVKQMKREGRFDAARQERIALEQRAAAAGLTLPTSNIGRLKPQDEDTKLVTI
jgi:hypothetical protein